MKLKELYINIILLEFSIFFGIMNYLCSDSKYIQKFKNIILKFVFSIIHKKKNFVYTRFSVLWRKIIKKFTNFLILQRNELICEKSNFHKHSFIILFLDKAFTKL